MVGMGGSMSVGYIAASKKNNFQTNKQIYCNYLNYDMYKLQNHHFLLSNYCLIVIEGLPHTMHRGLTPCSMENMGKHQHKNSACSS